MSEIYKSYETTELDASLKNDLKRLQDNIKNNKLIDDKADKIRQRERGNIELKNLGNNTLELSSFGRKTKIRSNDGKNNWILIDNKKYETPIIFRDQYEALKHANITNALLFDAQILEPSRKEEEGGPFFFDLEDIRFAEETESIRALVGKKVLRDAEKTLNLENNPKNGKTFSMDDFILYLNHRYRDKSNKKWESK